MEFRRVLFRSLFYWLARLVERRPALRRLKPVAVVRTFEETVRVEMDLRLEASAASELAGNFAGDPDFRVPAIDWRRTARPVLTLERSEEHTSELQSLMRISYAVSCWKKKTSNNMQIRCAHL